jgi:putative sterol carrier protein
MPITYLNVTSAPGFTSPAPFKSKEVFKMSDIVTAAVQALSEKLGDAVLDGSVKFEIEGEGGIVIDSNGVRASDDEADVTLSADADTFESILAGDTNPTAAFMSGKLSVDGDMGMAMKLGSLLS